MRIFVIGAGQVGSTIVEALHDEHAVTVFDIDPARLTALSHRFDVVTVEGNGASRATLHDAGIAQRGPRHRVHVAGRAEHHRRDARPKARTTRADDRPHVQRRVPRALARAPAGRRLRRLVRARSGARGHDDDRRPRRAADGRLRRGAGADRRVRRRGGRRARTSSALPSRTRRSRPTRRSRASSATAG